MNSKFFAIIAVGVIVVAGAGVFVLVSGNDDDQGYHGGEFTDMAGEAVNMPDTLNSISTIGAGTLRWISYFGLAEKVCASDQLQKGVSLSNNTYMYAYYDHFNSESVVKHSDARQSINLEKVLTSNNGEKPDVLVVLDTLVDANKTTVASIKAAGVAVFQIKSIQELLDDDYTTTDLFEKQARCIGKAFGLESRAESFLNGINGIFADIRDSVNGKTALAEKVYIGGLTIQSKRGLNTTASEYIPFKLISADNAVTTVGTTASPQQISTEEACKLITDNPGLMMFVDPAGWKMNGNSLCTGDAIIATALNKAGISEGHVIVPYNSYGLDYDNILVNCYLVSAYLYGLDMEEVNEKILDVYKLFYGDAAVDGDGNSIFERMCGVYSSALDLKFEEKVTFGNGTVTTENGKVYS